MHVQAARNDSLQLTDDMVNEALLHVEKQLSQHRKSLAMIPGIPLPTASHVMLPEEAAERAFDPQVLAAAVATNVPKLNADQQDVFDAVLNAVDTPLHQVSICA